MHEPHRSTSVDAGASRKGHGAHTRAPLGPLDIVELAVAAQLHLGLQAAHKGAVGHALLGEVLELVQNNLPMHNYKALHLVCLQAQM